LCDRLDDRRDVLASSVDAQQREPGEDHPLVTRYARAAMTNKVVKDFSSYVLIR